MKNLLLALMLFIALPAQADFFDFDKNKEIPVAAPLADKLTTTIKNLPDTGAAIEKIELINGIRAMDDEIASEGEVKILVNLNLAGVTKKMPLRSTLDYSTAQIITAVFSQHTDITKLRVILRTLNNKGKYQSVAKVFSFTRATWELTKNNPRYDLNTETGAANLLALGDYVILTDKGWTRGY